MSWPRPSSITNLDDFPFPWLRLSEELDRQLDRYLIAIRQKRDATGVVCLAIALQLIDNQEKFSCLSIRSDSPTQPQFNVSAVDGASEITVAFNAAAIEAIPAIYGEDRKHFYSMVLQAYPVAWKWIVQLTACCQVHLLKATDVANYFKQFPDFKKITSFNGFEVDCTAVLPYIKFTAPAIKWPQSDRGHKLVANFEIRSDFLSDSFFVKHHTTFSPTAEICLQLIDGLGSHVSKFNIDEEMLVAVNQSLTNYWDREFNCKIPVKLIAMAAAYAQFHGRSYGSWTEGRRALAETNPNLIDIWKDMFKIY